MIVSLHFHYGTDFGLCSIICPKEAVNILPGITDSVTSVTILKILLNENFKLLTYKFSRELIFLLI